MSTKSPAITLDRLTKRYTNLTAVDNLSLEIQEGEIFGLLGPNGSGKTTSLDMISGLITATSGTAFIRGLDPWRNARAVRSLFGFVRQETALYEDLTACENLRYNYALYGGDLHLMNYAINTVLDLMGLTDRAKDRVRTYSGGMKRRLALGRALLHDPEILFMDEPTLGVDVQSTHALWEHIKELKRRGKTVVVTTNVMAEADFLCDRVAIIDHGKLIALDTPVNLKASVGADRIILEVDRLSENSDDGLGYLKQVDLALEYQTRPGEIEIRLSRAAEKVQDILSALAGRYTIRRVEMRTPTLDDVFLHYTGRKLRD